MNDHYTFYVFTPEKIVFPQSMDPWQVVQGFQYSHVAFLEKVAKPFIYSIPGSLENTGVFLLETTDFLDTTWTTLPLSTFISVLDAGELQGSQWQALSRLLKAYHTTLWRKDMQFCSRCGTPLDDMQTEIGRSCHRCGNTVYPLITPAIIVAITNEKDEILLAHNYKFKEGMYSLVAGFVGPGERLEDTVRREVTEEVNLLVDAIHYVASQPWPFPYSLMVGFEATATEGTVHADGVEILDAGWFSREALPVLPQAGSLARLLIDRWYHKIGGSKI